MNSNLLWIVLGSLIGVVVIFLAVTVFLDRRKRRKVKLKTQAHTLETLSSSKKVALYLDLLVKRNAATLAEFKPSIGAFKMADIKRSAREVLKALKNSREYELLDALDDASSNELKVLVERLYETSANSWSKNGLDVAVSKLANEVNVSDYGDYLTQIETQLNQTYQWTPQIA